MSQTDIFITEKTGAKRQVRIPWLPDRVSFSSGGTKFVSYDIMDIGDIKKQHGETLRGFAWESFLPGAGHKHLPFLKGAWVEPIRYQEMFSGWQRFGTPLRLIMTGTPINHDVQIDEYHVDYSGAFGDYKYSIKFIDDRDLVISSTGDPETAPAAESKRTETVSTKETHTIVSGDTLWGIAQKYLSNGAKWQSVYDANKSAIEDMAKKRGYSGSDNGSKIFPGTILTIPGGG